MAGKNETDGPVTQTHMIKVGGYSNEHNANRELLDFRDAGVFAARSGIFPNPRGFNLQINVKSAAVREWDPGTVMNTHYIEAELEFTGKEEAIGRWLSQVNNRLRALGSVVLTRDGSNRNAPSNG